MTRPLCECHGEPMQRNGRQRTGGQKWRCSAGNNERMAEWYDELSNMEYLRRLLRHRRNQALTRMRRREEQTSPGTETATR